MSEQYYAGDCPLPPESTKALKAIFENRRRDLEAWVMPGQLPAEKIEREFVSVPCGPWSQRRFRRLLKEHVDRELMFAINNIKKLLKLELRES